MKKRYIYILSIWLILLFFILWYLYAWLKFAKPHFHANFLMYINGQRFDFGLDKYSEDIWKCKVDENITPKDRVHLHENNADTIHVHHEWVSWWHFFANNNFYFSDKYLILDDWKLYKNDDKNKLTFVLNWKIIKNPYNRMMNSEDRLLINYWNETEEYIVKERFKKVSENAWEYNKKYDPGTCSGTNQNSIFFLLEQLLHINH